MKCSTVTRPTRLLSFEASFSSHFISHFQVPITNVFAMHRNSPTANVFALYRDAPGTNLCAMHYTKIRHTGLGQIDGPLSEANTKAVMKHQVFFRNVYWWELPPNSFSPRTLLKYIGI